MSIKWKREYTELLIITMEQYPCLYNIRCAEYLDRTKKDQAFNDVLEIMRNRIHNITLTEIKNKWKNIRTQYVHELRILEQSSNSGSRASDVYVPKLWCFDQLSFLATNTKIKTIEPVKIQKKEKTTVNHDELLELATKRLKRSDDYSQTLANVWANEFRLASEEQQFFAKKAIDDILYEARLGTLHRNSVNINRNPEVINAYDSTLEPSRITSSPNRCLTNQTAYPQYIVHVPGQSKSSNSDSQSVKTENYNVSYVQENDLISIEPEITMRSER